MLVKSGLFASIAALVAWEALFKRPPSDPSCTHKVIATQAQDNGVVVVRLEVHETYFSQCIILATSLALGASG